MENLDGNKDVPGKGNCSVFEISMQLAYLFLLLLHDFFRGVGLRSFCSQFIVSSLSNFFLLYLRFMSANAVKDLENGVHHVSDSNVNMEKAKAGTAEYLIDLENRRSIKVSKFKKLLFRI